MPATQPSKLRQLFGILLLLLLFDFILYCSYLTYQQESKAQALKFDRAELSHIKYGMLSVDIWEEKLTSIVERKIEEYELSAENREELRQRSEALITRMIRETANIIREHHRKDGGITGWFKEKAFGMLVDVDDLVEDAPRIAEAFVAFLAEPENRDRIKTFVAGQLRKYAGETVGETDYRRYREVLARYNAVDGEEAIAIIDARLGLARDAVSSLTLLMVIALVPLLLAPFSQEIERRHSLVMLLFIALALLYVGIASPMIDIDARVGQLSFLLAGEPVQFNDQVLFFQSKSIMDVVRILLTKGDAKLALVGGLILLFSVLFPLTKILLTTGWLVRPRVRARNNPLVRFFVFKSGKWSMADVMVVAIFMAYLGFAGVMDSQLKQLDRSKGHLEVLTTSSSDLQIGFYFFTAFCLLGLFIAQMVNGRDSAKQGQREADVSG
jgi:hypothetical protein